MISQVKSAKERHSNRRGATAVEFAMVLPVLLLFVWSAIEFSRLAMVRHMADNASYEAARWVIVPGATEQEAIDRAEAVLATLGISNSTVTITPAPILENTPSVTVKVDVPFDGNHWLLPLFGNDSSLTLAVVTWN